MNNNMPPNSVSLVDFLHQTILDKTYGGIRSLHIIHNAKELMVSGLARDFYHVQLAIAAVARVRLAPNYSVRFQLTVDP
jgi:hypothetical protein